MILLSERVDFTVAWVGLPRAVILLYNIIGRVGKWADPPGSEVPRARRRQVRVLHSPPISSGLSLFCGRIVRSPFFIRGTEEGELTAAYRAGLDTVGPSASAFLLTADELQPSHVQFDFHF